MGRRKDDPSRRVVLLQAPAQVLSGLPQLLFSGSKAAGTEQHTDRVEQRDGAGDALREVQPKMILTAGV